MILPDTSVVIECFAGARPLLPELIRLVNRGERILVSSLVIYEWLRGERTATEIENLEEMVPSWTISHFEIEDAQIAARLYRSVRRPRSREADLAIAACALRHSASLWTLNAKDFSDIPGLQLYNPNA